LSSVLSSEAAAGVPAAASADHPATLNVSARAIKYPYFHIEDSPPRQISPTPWFADAAWRATIGRAAIRPVQSEVVY
jgi:hypothetical protein